MIKIFKEKIKVKAGDIDENGHVNNVVYVQWMQDIATSHSDVVGFNKEKYQELKSSWFIKSHFVEYHSPAFEGDEIEVVTWVSNIKKITSLRKYKFINMSNNKILATAETNWVYVDSESGRPKRIDEEARNAFLVVEESEEPV